MASPFPGMNPYLENPRLWRDVHNRLIVYIADDLNKKLRPRYRARIDERVYLAQSDRSILPDVGVRESLAKLGPSRRNGGVAVADVMDPPTKVMLEPESIREAFIDVKGEDGAVVTGIEVLSPTNKVPGNEGRREYRRKQKEILATSIHLLEIDLLRAGKHTVVAPLDKLALHGPYDYLISLSRGNERGCCWTWQFTVRDRLRRVSVPLGENDPDVVLDLQIVFDRVYAQGEYDQDIDYRQEAVPALRPADAEWADALLREKKLR